MRLHNGTIYRWNRPVYDVVDGVPHLRVENRVLAAGPTVVDTIANAAFYFGLIRALAEDDRPLWSRMSFPAAEENFHAAAQDGIDAQVFWPGAARSPPPSSSCGGCCRSPTRAWTVGRRARRGDPAARDHRAALRCTATAPPGTSTRCTHEEAGRPGRGDAADPQEYRELMHANEPVHTWPL